MRMEIEPKEFMKRTLSSNFGGSMRFTFMLLSLVYAAAGLPSLSPGAETLENSRAAFVFSDKRNFALAAVVDKHTGTRFDFDLAGGGTLWQMRRMAEGAPSATISAGRPSRIVRRADALRFEWEEAALEVRLEGDSGIAEWRLEWNAAGALPYSFTYPVVRPRAVGPTDRLYMPQRIGKVVDRPVGRDFEVTPTCPNWWSAQYVLFCGDPSAVRPVSPQIAAGKAIDGFVRGATPHEATLYFSADDPAFWRKDLILRGREGGFSFDLGLTHFPPWPPSPADWGGERVFEWKAPYAVRLGVLPGGAQRGIAEYRRQVAGKIPARRMSELAVGCRAWRSIHCSPGELAQIGHDIRETYRVPATLHHYRYSLGPFNWHFPELTSWRAGFREANGYLDSIGCATMPYGNSMRYDRALASYGALGMEKAAVVGLSGAVRATQLHGAVTSYMLPGAPEWIGWNRAFVADLFGKGGVHGFYLDEGAISPAPLDYRAARHAPHGGTYWCDGMRALADALRREGCRFRKDAFLSVEGFGEHLIGHIDDFLLYGLQFPRGLPSHARGFDHFPLMPLTYHDFAHAHSDRPDMSLGDDAFRLVMAQAWAWGMNIQVPATRTELDSGHAKKIAFCRDLVRCAWQVGDAYLSVGEMRYAALVPDAGQIGDAAIGVVSAPCRIDYRDKPWFGPSVLAGCFRDKATGNEAVALVNVTDRAQDVRIAADRRRIAPGKRRLFRSWPLPAKELAANGDVVFRLEAATAAFLEWRDDAPSPRALLSAPAPVPEDLLNIDPQLPSSDSGRTFHAFFAPGAILLPQAGDGVARSTLTVRNFADRPLTVRLNCGSAYRLRAKSEAMLPVAVACGTSSDPQRIPVRITSDDGLPRDETLFFETVSAAPADAIGHPLRPIRFSQPLGGPFRPMPFTISANARTFTLFGGWPGSGVGIVRTPDGQVAKMRSVGEDALLGMKYVVDVPAGAAGREWTYAHAWGQTYLAFGEGVEPLRIDALAGFPQARARATDAVGCVNRFGNLEIELPDAAPGGPVWTVAARIAYQETTPCVVLRCDLGARRRGRIDLPMELWTDKGQRMTGYIQAFAPGADGVADVIAGDQSETKRPRGTQRFSLSLEPPCEISAFDVVMSFAVTPKHRLKVFNPRWRGDLTKTEVKPPQ